jgi:serine/threonine protein kinase
MSLAPAHRFALPNPRGSVAGGWATVYAALDLSLGRSVALKFLPRTSRPSAAAQARFLAEAKAASLLDHPNIGVIHELRRQKTAVSSSP